MPFTCDICRTSFAHKGALQTHKKFKHALSPSKAIAPSNPFCSWFRKALVGRRLRSYHCPNMRAMNALRHKSLAMKIHLAKLYGWFWKRGRRYWADSGPACSKPESSKTKAKTSSWNRIFISKMLCAARVPRKMTFRHLRYRRLLHLWFRRVTTVEAR